jgi:mono/diheme cytochrome c family protein
VAGAISLRATPGAVPAQDAYGLNESAIAAAAAHADDLADQAYEILKTNCFECHGAAKRSGLDMRTHESLMTAAQRQGDRPARAAKSRLYLYASQSGTVKMPPPPNEKLDEDDLKILYDWILAGGSLEGVKAATAAASRPRS